MLDVHHAIHLQLQRETHSLCLKISAIHLQHSLRIKFTSSARNRFIMRNNARDTFITCFTLYISNNHTKHIRITLSAIHLHPFYVQLQRIFYIITITLRNTLTLRNNIRDTFTTRFVLYIYNFHAKHIHHAKPIRNA